VVLWIAIVGILEVKRVGNEKKLVLRRGLRDLIILNPICIKVINYATQFSGVTYTLLWCPLAPYPKSTLSTTFTTTGRTTNTCYKDYNGYYNSSQSGGK